MSVSLRIGILGTRGIPNRYGGFEQCAEKLAAGLVAKGHQVWVYNSHNHEYKNSEWQGVHIIHCNDPEHRLGTAGQFIYDLNCINNARRRKFDVLLQLGYTSNSIWYWRWPRQAKNIVNMDGLEWKRSKYSKPVQQFLKRAERLAAVHGDVLIADSIGIQQHLQNTYNKPSHFIAYGADIFTDPEEQLLSVRGMQLVPYSFNMLIARMEPENNIEMIIKAHIASRSKRPLLVVGKTENAFGSYLVKTYGSASGIQFLGGIYDASIINNMRYYSHLYFHGHSVGGTNPSLIEAMGCSALIAAHDNPFNKGVLDNDAFYFTTADQLTDIINSAVTKSTYQLMLDNNLEKIRKTYNWDNIVNQYAAVMLQAVSSK
jgi:glycosyltransferase involved in cell wall biosynthesis